jgi:hypothetical protein
MADTSVILDKIDNYSSFACADLQSVMEECGYQTSKNIVNHLIAMLLASGTVARIGRNRYCVSGSLKTYDYHHSAAAVSLADEIMKAHPYLDFRIFELVQLNEFVNHQLAHNIIFVSVEGGLEGDVFNTLWESHKGSVLLKPGVAEFFRYMDDDMVVIMKLPTESPKGMAAFWDTRLEKMLVDIAVDKLLRKIVYSGEYRTIYQEAFGKYVIDRSLMFRYAGRRGALEKYRAFLLNEAGLKEEDLQI